MPIILSLQGPYIYTHTHTNGGLILHCTIISVVYIRVQLKQKWVEVEVLN